MKLLEQRDLNWKGCRTLLSDDPDTLITPIMAIAAAALPPEFWTWDPLLVFKELEEFFDCHISVETENKIHAGMLCSQTDGFFTDPEICTAFTTTTCHGDPGVDLLEETPAIGEFLWSTYEAILLFGECELQPPVAALFTQAYSEADGDSLMDVTTYLADQRRLLEDQLRDIGCTKDHLRELPEVPGAGSEEPPALSGAILSDQAPAMEPSFVS